MTNAKMMSASESLHRVAVIVADQLIEQGLIATLTACDDVEVSLIDQPKYKVWIVLNRAKGTASVSRRVRQKPFQLTAEGLKNPKGVADRVREMVQERIDRAAAEDARVAKAEALVEQVNAAGFVAKMDGSCAEVENYNGKYLRASYDNKGVHVSLDVPAEKLAALKAFLDQLEA